MGNCAATTGSFSVDKALDSTLRSVVLLATSASDTPQVSDVVDALPTGSFIRSSASILTLAWSLATAMDHAR